MVQRKSFILVIIALVLGGADIWAGDVASFVDLGFSPDGKTYMFGQYGVEAHTLRPWADVGVVDVSRNDFVPGGRASYTRAEAVSSGQDGSGALFRLISRNSDLSARHGVDSLLQGRPLYISVETPGSLWDSGETIEFRDFENDASYQATLLPSFEGSGDSLKSSFCINLERTDRNGSMQTYIVGTPELKRPLVSAYSIRKALIDPQDGSIIFVIAMKKPGDGGFDLRYMVEALRF